MHRIYARIHGPRMPATGQASRTEACQPHGAVAPPHRTRLVPAAHRHARYRPSRAAGRPAPAPPRLAPRQHHPRRHRSLLRSWRMPRRWLSPKGRGDGAGFPPEEVKCCYGLRAGWTQLQTRCREHRVYGKDCVAIIPSYCRAIILHCLTCAYSRYIRGSVEGM